MILCLPFFPCVFSCWFDEFSLCQVAGFGGGYAFTDEELRSGDPSDTIRRASMMPGQLHDSLASHRYSLIVGRSGTAATAASHRLSLMPGQLPSSKTISSSHLRSPKGSKRSASTLSAHQTSPEVGFLVMLIES